MDPADTTNTLSYRAAAGRFQNFSPRFSAKGADRGHRGPDARNDWPLRKLVDNVGGGISGALP